MFIHFPLCCTSRLSLFLNLCVAYIYIYRRLSVFYKMFPLPKCGRTLVLHTMSVRVLGIREIRNFIRHLCDIHQKFCTCAASKTKKNNYCRERSLDTKLWQSISMWRFMYGYNSVCVCNIKHFVFILSLHSSFCFCYLIPSDICVLILRQTTMYKVYKWPWCVI